ncbi:unnamed protein product [Lymnaea stagnalis]|uniref:Atrial natriuretic peptide-converting enzyme n=1 Tax=Lymnaea stagnalis TaxID=6523 RepID=A0AAV2H3L3_LYMST
MYDPDMADQTSPAFTVFRNAFIFKMDTIFMSSNFSNMYNRTQILNTSENRDHVALSFAIQIQPRFMVPTSSNLIGQIQAVIITGLRNSVFVIDSKSMRLWINAYIPPTTTPSPPGQCLPITIASCVNITSYSKTSFPNVVGHRSPAEVEIAIKHKYYSVIQPFFCYPLAPDFYCSVFAPECGSDGKPIPPCREYCMDVMKLCKVSYQEINTDQIPVSCESLPESEDPAVCRQNPYKPGTCVPVNHDMCSSYGINKTSYPNVIRGVAVEKPLIALQLFQGIYNATHCYKHLMLFACAFFVPNCTGKPEPYNTLPPCASLCQAFRDRCQIFFDIFEHAVIANISCSDLPDSPDPTVCMGYHEAREPDFKVCGPGEIKCGKNSCIKRSWICDGNQDCDDNSDEAHCATCDKSEMACVKSYGRCINKTQGCDGADDCYTGVDENFCVQMDATSDKDVLQAYNPISAEWEEVCKDNWTSEFSTLVCKQLGYHRVLATYYKDYSNKTKTAILTSLKDGSDPNRLQSFLKKGQPSCPSGYVVRIVCMDAVCGIRPAYYRSPLRVVGGDEVKPGALPWMASLHGGLGEAFFCGATVINEQWILTAGHCIGGGEHGDLKYWTIQTGSTRRVAYSKYRQIRRPKRMIKHPAFNVATVDNDVALIQLEKPLAMNDYVRPICLPEKQPEEGTRCYAAGWGKNDNFAQRYEAALKQVPLDISSWEYCKNATSNASGNKIVYALTKSMFCAGGADSHDACQGDSGGPLLCRKENTTDEWYQGGIVSWGVICGHPRTPGVYTNLPLYVDWIRETITNASEKLTL